MFKVIHLSLAIALANLPSIDSTSCVAEYNQCGGREYTGSTQCCSPFICHYINDYYSQCLRGSTVSASSTSTTAGASTGCNTLYSQCGGQNWPGSTCCTSSTCVWFNEYYSQCLTTSTMATARSSTLTTRASTSTTRPSTSTTRASTSTTRPSTSTSGSTTRPPTPSTRASTTTGRPTTRPPTSLTRASTTTGRSTTRPSTSSTRASTTTGGSTTRPSISSTRASTTTGGSTTRPSTSSTRASTTTGGSTTRPSTSSTRASTTTGGSTTRPSTSSTRASTTTGGSTTRPSTSSTRASTTTGGSTTRPSTSSTRASTTTGGSTTRPATSSTRASTTTGGSTTSTARPSSSTTTSSVQSCSAVYDQCGGLTWTGPRTCCSGSSCQYSNDYYSQCLPVSGASTSSRSTVSASTTSIINDGRVNGVTTRYWDCCKASCGWAGKASVTNAVETCAQDGITPVGVNTQSGCTGGTAYMCNNQQPWNVSSTLSYGYAAAYISGKGESDWCCACYSLNFTTGPVAGKELIVQVTNTGGDLGNNHFDLQMPGGGVGIFDGCSRQFPGSYSWGQRYGGISQRSDCYNLPSALLSGCLWRFDWFMDADNPQMRFKQVTCPAALTTNTQCIRL